MDKQMIRWKLHEIMASKRRRNVELAKALDITPASVSRLRKKDLMPRLTPELLNGVCAFLDCQPGELLVYTPDTGNQEDRNEH
jgi:putative transcriptional regulator